MPLIKKIYEASHRGDLRQPFTTKDLKAWMTVNNIVKDDGDPYASASIDAMLSNSDIANNPTTNKNQKVLQSRLNSGGMKEYWF